MIKKFALHPFASRATDFKVGQSVKIMITSHYGSSFIGTVLALHPSIDKVDVQWPHQVGRHSPEDLLPVSSNLGEEPAIRAANEKVRPTVVDLMVPSSTSSKVVDFVGGIPTSSQLSVVASHLQKSAQVLKDAMSLKREGSSEMEVFSKVSSAHGNRVSDEEIRFIVSSLFDKKVAYENAVYLTVVHDLIDA